jgi:hypothetical protein
MDDAVMELAWAIGRVCEIGRDLLLKKGEDDDAVGEGVLRATD